MEADSQQSSLEPLPSVDSSEPANRFFPQLNHPDTECFLCKRSLSMEVELNEISEAICICRECKIMVLNSNITSPTTSEARRGAQHRNIASLESIEDSFSRQFSRLINLADQSHEAHIEGDTPVTLRQHVGRYRSQSRSRRRHRPYSDNESDAIDSIFGDSDSIVSFGGYGGDLDTSSMDRNSSLYRDIFSRIEYDSYTNSDTDIDPMHAGLSQWNSDDEDDDDGNWEEADFDDTNVMEAYDEPFEDMSISPAAIAERSAQGGVAYMQRVHYIDFANVGRHVDVRGIGDLLEQLAETDGSRRGAPPAAASVIGNLPFVLISKDHEKNGDLICAVCKDPILLDTKANQLPCMHLYHPSCILPWLNERNSCPVCRYELPTDDPEYEAKKKIVRRLQNNDRQMAQPDEIYNTPNGMEAADHVLNRAGIEHGNSEDADQIAERSDREDTRGRWLFLAAAPIVSVLGVVLALWLRKHSDGRRSMQEQQIHRSRSTISVPDRNRRWWSIF